MAQLIWDTKSHAAPPPGALQTEAVIYPHGAGYPQDTAEDRLIWGDNLAIMSALLPEYEGRIKLIYTDPPFFTNRRYRARVGRGEDPRRPQDWQLAEGYPDDWSDLDAYLDMLYPRLVLMHRLLAPDGSLYLHLDWHADGYARVLLDEIFGANRLLNQIIWVYHGPSPIRSAFNRKHDVILAYTKSDRYTFNVDDVREPYNESTVKTFASSKKAGFGKVPNLARGKVPEDWWYFPVVARLHSERTGYPTQKPEAMLERILLAASNPGDLTADFFCGSGTSAAVASRLGRRFIASDAAWRAVHTTRARLVRAGAPPFRLERETNSVASFDYPPLTGAQVEVHGEQVRLLTEPGADWDYWEIDPHWDGAVFHSAAQAVRPLRKGTIPTTLELPPSTQAGTCCARLVTAGGQRFQAIPPRGET